MKKLIESGIVLIFLIILSGCTHEHTWKEATCTEPKICIDCGEKEGAALGHAWVEASCEESKHCTRCGLKDGKALGHTWIDATCSEAKRCSKCGETEGGPLGHTTDVGRCSRCKEVINKDLIVSFSNELQIITEKDLPIDTFNASTLASAYTSSLLVRSSIENKNDQFNKVIEKYSAYDGFKEVLDEIRLLIKKTPSMPEKESDSIQTFLTELETYLIQYQAFLGKMVSFVEVLK